MENIIVLVVVVAVAYMTIKRDLLSLKGNAQTLNQLFNETVYFWKQLLRNPIRIVCFAVICLCEFFRNGLAGIIMMAIILPLVTYLLIKEDVIKLIDWDSVNVQNMVSLMAIAAAFIWLVGSLIGFQILFYVLMIVSVIIGVVAVIILATRKE